MATPGERPIVWVYALLLLACTAMPVAGAGEYRTAEVESLKIVIDSEWGMRTTPGYVPVRLDITNAGEARVIEIVGQGMRFARGSRGAGSSSAGYAIRQAVRLARGDRVRLTIPVPVYADNENIRFEIHQDGRVLERFNYLGFMSGSRPEHASALIVADTGSAFGKVAEGWVTRVTAVLSGSVTASGGVTVSGGVRASGVTVPPGGSMPPMDFLLPPSRLPDNWLGFTSVRAVIIGPAEWEQLNERQKHALLTWTACGGDLLFVDGTPSALFPTGQQPPASTDPVRAYFFGRIHVPTSASISAAGVSDVLSKAWGLQDPNWALPANRAADWGVITERGFRLPIPGVEGVPARAYLMILIAFSILIGPANYLFLRRSRQQVLMVLTTPLIAATFIVLLGAYVLAGEGFGVRGRAVTFTMLDQVRKQAATRASISLYAAGMMPWGGLSFARDEAVFPIGTDGTGSHESQAIDLTDSQRFLAGVIQARSPTNVETIGFRPARERLSFDPADDGMSVLNGLGGTIRALLYRRGNNFYELTGTLLPGHRGLMKAGRPGAGDIVPIGLPQSSRFEHLIKYQPDGSYLAVLERSPFWNAGVAAVDERGSFHLVLGWVGGQP